MTPSISDNVVACPGALILGGGLAGLFTALKLAPYPATIVSASAAGHSGSSVWAQGGVAAAMGPDDNPELHAADTIAAGAGLCDPIMAGLLTREAPARIADLIGYGVPFDRDAAGDLALGLEAAHSRKRIVHVQGDRSGLLIMRALATAARATPSITFAEGFHAIQLAVADGRVVGLFARQSSRTETRIVFFRACSVVMATGGLGALYAVTTNPIESRGEGLGMAARAGARIADPEFVQFHPTAMAVGHDPAPLVSETVRGAGAILLNETDARFMPAVHPAAELAPRDVVARAVHREIARGGKVFLDARSAVGAAFPERFPAIYQAAIEAGIDPICEAIPIAPAAHYHMGGIATGEAGRSSVEGLWACGECACTGVHGANRLASNSLLEALVFGARIAEDVCAQIPARLEAIRAAPLTDDFEPAPVAHTLRETMSRHVGIERDASGLHCALADIAAVERAGGGNLALLNITAAAKLVATAALARRESRGAHFRSDYPQTDEMAQRTFLTLAEAEALAAQVTDAAPRTIGIQA